MGSDKRQAKTQEKARQLREQARELKQQAREMTRDSGLEERASELAEQATELATRVRESEALARAQAKGSELAGRAREAIQESGLDERAADLGKRVRESERYQTARDQAGERSDKALAAVGGWLAQGPAAKKMGLRAVDRKRTTGKWLLALLGVIAGFAAGAITGARKKETVDELSSIAGRIGQDTPDMGTPAAQKPIADEVRTRLGEDPRTSTLPKLNVNVAEGTVFVRGAVPEGTDEDAIRAVVGTVPGVQDIDLQLTSSASS